MPSDRPNPSDVNEMSPPIDTETSALEAELASLFAETRVDPSSIALSRLAAKATDIPSSARPWWRRLPAPLLLGGLAAITVAVAATLYVGSLQGGVASPSPELSEADGLAPLAPGERNSRVKPVRVPPVSHVPDIREPTVRAVAPSVVAAKPEPAAPTATEPVEVLALADPSEEADLGDEAEDTLAMVDDDLALGFDLIDLPDDDEAADALLDAYDRELGDG